MEISQNQELKLDKKGNTTNKAKKEKSQRIAVIEM